MLRQLGGKLTGEQVMIVAMLPAVLLHPIFIEKVADVAVAHRLRHFIGYLPTVCSSANYAAIRESAERIGNLSVSDWVRRWTARFDKLPHPLLISDDPELVVLATGAAMTQAGRRYSNCMSSNCTRVALGRSLFVDYRPADGRDGLLAELLRVGDYWHLHQMHASGNRRIRAGVAATLRKRLAGHGILILAHAPCEAETLRAIAQLAGDYTFADEDIGGFGLLEAEEDHAEPQAAEEVLAALTEAPE